MSNPDPIDVHVGSRLRERRKFLNMSQGKIGNNLGLTFQQIQKYEKGANRIGSSRIFKLSKMLNVPVKYFFEDMPENVEQHARNYSLDNPETFDQDRLVRRETLELVLNYYLIKDPKVRKGLFTLIKSIAKVGKKRRGL